MRLHSSRNIKIFYALFALMFYIDIYLKARSVTILVKKWFILFKYNRNLRMQFYRYKNSSNMLEKYIFWPFSPGSPGKPAPPQGCPCKCNNYNFTLWNTCSNIHIQVYTYMSDISRMIRIGMYFWDDKWVIQNIYSSKQESIIRL